MIWTDMNWYEMNWNDMIWNNKICQADGAAQDQSQGWLKRNSEGIRGSIYHWSGTIYWSGIYILIWDLYIDLGLYVQMTNQYYISPPGRCDLLLSNIEHHQYLIFPIFVCSLSKSKWFAIENFAFDLLVCKCWLFICTYLNRMVRIFPSTQADFIW